MKNKIRELINEFFMAKAKELKISSGDISPSDEVILDRAVDEITEVYNNWLKINK